MGKDSEHSRAVASRLLTSPGWGSALHRPNIEEFVARLASIQARRHQSVSPTFAGTPAAPSCPFPRRRNNHLLSRQVITTARLCYEVAEIRLCLKISRPFSLVLLINFPPLALHQPSKFPHFRRTLEKLTTKHPFLRVFFSLAVEVSLLFGEKRKKMYYCRLC